MVCRAGVGVLWIKRVTEEGRDEAGGWGSDGVSCRAPTLYGALWASGVQISPTRRPHWGRGS